MAVNKNRQTMKNDISKHWQIAGEKNFIPLAGEIIVYSDLNKIKIGDGINNVNNLSFLQTDSTNLEEDIKSLINKDYIASLLNIYNGDISYNKEV